MDQSKDAEQEPDDDSNQKVALKLQQETKSDRDTSAEEEEGSDDGHGEEGKDLTEEEEAKKLESIKRYADLRHHKIRLEDAIDPNAERVYELKPNDIVFGRGKWCQRHPGNQRMRKITERYKIKYLSLIHI